MNKAIKWILIIIAGLGGLFVVALLSLPFIIDPNDYKDQISTVVQEQTGRSLSIPGDIKLKVSPKLDVAFSLGEIQLAASKDFPDPPFASSSLAEIKLALWPLVSKKQIQINTIELKGVQLNLIRNSEGKTNWEDLLGASAQQATPPSTTATPASKQTPAAQPSATTLPTIDVGSINITDINVQYQDQQAGKTISLNNFNLKVGHLQEDVPFPVAADFTFNLDDNKQPLSATIKTNCNLTLNLSRQHFIIKGLNLDGLFQGDMFPSSSLKLALTADAEISLPDEKVVLTKLTLQQGEFNAETALTLKGFKTPAIDGTLRIAPYSPKSHLTKLGIPLPKFTDPKVLESLSASLGFKLGNDNLELQAIQVQLDDTTIKADAAIQNLQHPAYTLTMNVDQLDLDRYAVQNSPKKQTPQDSQESKVEEQTEQKTPTSQNTQTTAAASKQQKEAEGQIILPVHLLRDLAFNADVTINSLKAAKLRLSDIVLQTEGKDGLIRLQPFSAKLYEGSLTVTGAIDARPEVPEIRLKKVLQGVQLGPMFVDLVGKEEISGRADIEVDAVTRGVDQQTLTANANGRMKLSLSNGRIAQLQILETIRMAKALLEGKVPTPSSQAQPTGFATLTATGTITNGVFKNSDLLAESDLMKITGKGTADLVQQKIDYLLTVYLTDRIEREQGTGLVELGDMPIPYRVKGSFSELQQSAAIEELVKAKAKDMLFDTLEKQLGTGSDKKGKSEIDAGSLINQGLKGLFGN